VLRIRHDVIRYKYITASLGVSASLSEGIQRCFTRPQTLRQDHVQDQKVVIRFWIPACRAEYSRETLLLARRNRLHTSRLEEHPAFTSDHSTNPNRII
jgi:hypothetical protein